MERFVQNHFIGVSHGGHSAKIHAAVGGLGNPIKVFLTSGEVPDTKAARVLLTPIDILGSTVPADRAYSTRVLREYIANRNAEYCIPPKSNAIALLFYRLGVLQGESIG